MIRDSKLPHQVVLFNKKHSGKIFLTCNCRVRAKKDPIGETVDFADTARLYNDPNNHVEFFDLTQGLSIQHLQEG